MKSIDQANFKDKKVLVRVDYNVPLNDKLEVTSTTRIERTKDTVRKITGEGGVAILMSHLGRPKGKYEESMSLKHIVPAVSEIMGQPVYFLGDVTDKDIEERVKRLKPGDIGLLENLRFHEEEEKGGREFAERIAHLGDIYVNDAFGTAHRAHASTTVIAQFFPGQSYAGYLLYNEDYNLQRALSDPRRPFTAIIGGAKISTKINIIKNLLDKVDHIIITGAMSYTFLKAFGGKVGNSLVEDDMLDIARDIVHQSYLRGATLYLPSDSVCGDSFSAEAKTFVTEYNDIPDGWTGLDIGPRTVRKFGEVIKGSATLLWNGPAGVFEMDTFSRGTKSLAYSIAGATASGSFSLIGGGDTISAIGQYGLKDFVSYISTGGGAMLEYLEGQILPGIDALNKN